MTERPYDNGDTRATLLTDRKALINSYEALRQERNELLDRVSQLEALLAAENERKAS